MKVILNGAAGHMGHEVAALLNEGYAGSECAALVDSYGADGAILPSLNDFTGEADVIIDFSNHESAPALCSYAVRHGMALVVATTAHTPEEKEEIYNAAHHIPVFYSANMSLGIAVLCRMAAEAAKLFPDADIEIVEKHHNRKLDAPSGTALMLAECVKEARGEGDFVLGRSGQQKRKKGEIGISALRLANVAGEHEIIIATEAQTLTLKHEAHGRGLFAEGALQAASFITGLPAGIYNMEDMLSDLNPAK